jgi:hypothetical protein
MRSLFYVSAVMTAIVFTGSVAFAENDKEAMIKDALSAAPPKIAAGAAVMDWEGNLLRGGYSDWTCYPTGSPESGTCPMCIDQPWQELIGAWVGKTDYTASRVGIAYMLAGDCPTSNDDPYAAGPTADNHWMEEGPHLMIIVPDAASLEGLSTDPYSGRPYVMWKGTPYQHIMIPTAGN